MPRCHADGSPVTRSAAVARSSVKRRPMPAGTLRTPSSDAPRGATRTAPSSTCTADTPSSRLPTTRVPSAGMLPSRVRTMKGRERRSGSGAVSIRISPACSAITRCCVSNNTSIEVAAFNTTRVWAANVSSRREPTGVRY
ncbi:hypothetical protein G6F24_015258 [Rhizopus arrhizus]|nr:hypothetical protein G6F24_015258 [Rhizopus arrhizus]